MPKDKELFAADLFGGADLSVPTGVRARVFTEFAWHSAVHRNLSCAGPDRDLLPLLPARI